MNPILAQAAALGDVSMLAGFDEDITSVVPDGVEVEVDPQNRLLTVLAWHRREQCDGAVG